MSFQIWYWSHNKQMSTLPYAHEQELPTSDMYKVAKEIVDLGFDIMIRGGDIMFVSTGGFSQR